MFVSVTTLACPSSRGEHRECTHQLKAELFMSLKFSLSQNKSSTLRKINLINYCISYRSNIISQIVEEIHPGLTSTRFLHLQVEGKPEEARYECSSACILIASTNIMALHFFWFISVHLQNREMKSSFYVLLAEATAVLFSVSVTATNLLETKKHLH